MKRVDRVAPITIQAKVGALARCTDWGRRKEFLTMPDAHAAFYTKANAAAAGVERQDVERDIRLEPGECEKFLK